MKSVIKVCTGTFFLTVALLVALDMWLGAYQPLKKLSDSGLGGLNYYYVVAKLPEFLSSRQNPDVVMTGSSLWLYPSVRCDDVLAGVKTRYDSSYVCKRIDGCLDSKYFESRLPKGTEVVNLGTAGALMSDQYVVLKKMIAACKKPSVVLCDISPRQFLDKNQPDPTKTPVYCVLADFTGLGDILARGRDFASTCDYAFGALSNGFKARRDVRLILTNLASAISGHPTDLIAAKGAAPKYDLQTILHPASAKANYTPPADMTADLNAYRKEYLPVNSKMRDTQMEYLRKYLKLARENNIPVVCVNMPLTSANTALLPADELASLKASVAAAATEYGATLYTPKAQYDDSDFEDSAHLNEKGGRKFFDELAVETTSVLAPH